MGTEPVNKVILQPRFVFGNVVVFAKLSHHGLRRRYAYSIPRLLCRQKLKFLVDTIVHAFTNFGAG